MRTHTGRRIKAAHYNTKAPRPTSRTATRFEQHFFISSLVVGAGIVFGVEMEFEMELIDRTCAIRRFGLRPNGRHGAGLSELERLG